MTMKTLFQKFSVFTIAALAASASASWVHAAEATPFVTVAGCAPSDYIAVSGAEVRIAIAGRGYSPRCMKIAAGTVVTIEATSRHPLQAMRDISGASNPFLGTSGDWNSNQSRTMTHSGIYGYFCTDHGEASGRGMAGSIWVE
jgi:plastocyanin